MAVGAKCGEQVLEQVTILVPVDRVRLDSEQLEILYRRLGEDGAENVLCRAMEEMAIRLKQAQSLYHAGALAELRKTVRTLVAMAEQVGFNTISRVSQDVVICIDTGDSVALGATLSRLIRSGEKSLTAIWDMQDITV